MRRLLILVLAGAAAAAVAQLLQRYLQTGGDPFVGSAEHRPSAVPATSAANGTHPTREELYKQARELDVEGRSKMNKRQLQEAVEAAKIGGRS
jgi:hypothetical protein